jgi:hypothetical protein
MTGWALLVLSQQLRLPRQLTCARVYRKAAIQNVPRGKDIVLVILSKKCFTVQYTVHCTDEQHAMFSHELQSALMLTVEFSKMYYNR